MVSVVVMDRELSSYVPFGFEKRAFMVVIALVFSSHSVGTPLPRVTDSYFLTALLRRTSVASANDNGPSIFPPGKDFVSGCTAYSNFPVTRVGEPLRTYSFLDTGRLSPRCLDLYTMFDIILHPQTELNLGLSVLQAQTTS